MVDNRFICGILLVLKEGFFVKPEGIRYLVSYHPAMYGLPADTAGTLDVVNTLSGNAFWFDNDNEEWHKSVYSAESTLEGLGTEYEEVESFSNGYISTSDLWVHGTKTSLIDKFPNEFAPNLQQTSAKKAQTETKTPSLAEERKQ